MQKDETMNTDTTMLLETYTSAPAANSMVERSFIDNDHRILSFYIERLSPGAGARLPPGTYDMSGISFSSESVILPVTIVINTRSKRSRTLRKIIRAGRRGDRENAIPLLLDYIERRGHAFRDDWTRMAAMTKKGKARYEDNGRRKALNPEVT